MKFATVTSLLALAASTAAMPNKRCTDNYTVPFATIANIKVVDTPLAQKARALVEANFEPYLVRHIDRRFEIDGYIGATNWIKENGAKADWDNVRLQLIWDTISLQMLTEEDYNSIIEAYDQSSLLDGTNDTFTFLCRTKAESTYDTRVEPWGVAFVEGYSLSATVYSTVPTPMLPLLPSRSATSTELTKT
ncbi:hypothetical protein E0Z10_g6164 [Xylaria hypoxylon]|uniref:Uncharacterized protein n=1 Tax=Xylaria hypoxylon TaxID=37992 RepID=A0A4Z0YTZ4_9PEZI|nr:hypothetical protein E0Z10_g6164 [Xylaria hypoxylon]